MASGFGEYTRESITQPMRNRILALIFISDARVTRGITLPTNTKMQFLVAVLAVCLCSLLQNAATTSTQIQEQESEWLKEVALALDAHNKLADIRLHELSTQMAERKDRKNVLESKITFLAKRKSTLLSESKTLNDDIVKFAIELYSQELDEPKTKAIEKDIELALKIDRLSAELKLLDKCPQDFVYEEGKKEKDEIYIALNTATGDLKGALLFSGNSEIQHASSLLAQLNNVIATFDQVSGEKRWKLLAEFSNRLSIIEGNLIAIDQKRQDIQELQRTLYRLRRNIEYCDVKNITARIETEKVDLRKDPQFPSGKVSIPGRKYKQFQNNANELCSCRHQKTNFEIEFKALSEKLDLMQNEYELIASYKKDVLQVIGLIENIPGVKIDAFLGKLDLSSLQTFKINTTKNQTTESFTNLNDQIAKLQNENKAANQANIELEYKISALTNENEKLDTKSKQLEVNNKTLTITNEELIAKNQALIEQLDKKEPNAAELTLRITDLRNDVKAAGTKIQTLESENDRLKREKQNAESENQTLKDSAVQNLAKISSLQGEIHTISNKLSQAPPSQMINRPKESKTTIGVLGAFVGIFGITSVACGYLLWQNAQIKSQ